MSTSNREEIDDGIYLNATSTQGDSEFVYTVENHTDETLSFTYDFFGSENIYIVDGDNPLKISITVKPGTISNAVYVRKQNKRQPHSVRLSKHLDFDEHDFATFQQFSKSWDAAIGTLLGNTLNLKDISGDKDRKSITDKIDAVSGTLFIDPSFPPFSKTLYNVVSNKGKYKYITYRKLAHFARDSVMFGDKINADDIILGNLPDSWLISAIATIAELPELILNIFPEEFRKVDEYGVYKIYLYVQLEKTAFIMDDYFPCFASGGPAYTRSIGEHANYAWILIVEKAFAKMFGGYTKLTKGFPNEAMMDLTGYPALSIRLDDAEIRRKLDDDSFWNTIVEYSKRGSLMSVSTGKAIEEQVGLLSGHTFCVLKLVYATSGERLIKLRDPWNLLEFLSSWGRKSPQWTAKLREEVGATEGEYTSDVQWVSFEALVERFEALNVLLVHIQDNKVINYKEYRKQFNFEYNPQSSIPECPSFVFEAKLDTTVIFTIQQEDNRISKSYIDVGIVVLLTNLKKDYEFVATKWISVERQVILSIAVTKGCVYNIVPISSGCKFKQYLQSIAKYPPPTEELARKVMFKIHADEVFSCRPREFDELLRNKAIELALMSGNTIEAVKEKVSLYFLKSGCAGISYAAKNVIDKPIHLNIDFEDGDLDMISHQGTLKTSELIDPGAFKVLHHICPRGEEANLTDDWDAAEGNCHNHSRNNSDKDLAGKNELIAARLGKTMKSTGSDFRSELSKDSASPSSQKVDQVGSVNSVGKPAPEAPPSGGCRCVVS